MTKILALIFSLFATAVAAQPTTQSGNITPGHLTCWAAPNVIYDCGIPGSATNLTVGTTGIINGTNGLCFYDAIGVVGLQSCSGGFSSGAATSGCAMGALVYTDPSTGNVRCDTQTTITPDVFGAKISAEEFTAIGGIFAGVSTSSLVSTGSAPDFSSGTCSVSAPLGATLSGQFTANGACAGGTIVLTSSIVVTNGLSCMVNNQTSAARVIRQTATTSSPSVTATFIATINSGDVINYICVGY